MRFNLLISHTESSIHRIEVQIAELLKELSVVVIDIVRMGVDISLCKHCREEHYHRLVKLWPRCA